MGPGCHMSLCGPSTIWLVNIAISKHGANDCAQTEVLRPGEYPPNLCARRPFLRRVYANASSGENWFSQQTVSADVNDLKCEISKLSGLVESLFSKAIRPQQMSAWYSIFSTNNTFNHTTSDRFTECNRIIILPKIIIIPKGIFGILEDLLI